MGIQHVTNEQKHFSDSTHFYKFSNSVSLMKRQSEKGNHSKAMSLILDREDKELKEMRHLKQYSKTYANHNTYDSSDYALINSSPPKLNGISHSNISEITKFVESSSPPSVVRKRSTTMPTVKSYNSHHL